MKVPPCTSSVLTVLLCAAALLPFAAFAPAQDPLQVLNNQIPPEVSNGQAALVQSLPADHLLYFSIVLPLRNQPVLKNLLQRLYNPSDPDYRNFLTVDQFTEQFGPTVDDYNAVVSFVQANGFTVTGAPANRLIVPVSGTAAQIEKAFNVKMNVYQHPTENRLFFSPDRDPSLYLGVSIKGISGLSNFSVPRPALARPALGGGGSSPSGGPGSGPYGSYLPSDMRAAYYGSGPLTGSGQCVGLAEFGGYGIGDVVSTFNGYATETPSGSNYILTYTPPAGGGPYNIQITNLPQNSANIGTYNGDEIEVVLDIAQAIGMAPGMSQVRVYFAPDAWTVVGNDEFPSSNDDTVILNQMAADAPPYGAGCYQLSISWNWRPENPLNDQDEGVFEELQLQGQGFFNASGDYGSWTTNSACSYGSCFVYPEESPNVIAVGGTDLTTSGPGGSWISESGWSNSGGGISPDLFPIPSYQSGLGGINGTSTVYRNAPDVAMEANTDNYFCYFGSCSPNPSCTTLDISCAEGGTSFAAPRWAGFTALVNQQAAANSSPAIGFLNPYIYPIGEGPNYLTDFNEVVGG
ncbi:MAG: protease pro-enzyme activation domain-containing protein [Terracidiphilus sp.]